jgi:hypothetical protein
MSSRVFFEPIKSLGFAGISGAYASIGAPTTHPVRICRIDNNTEGDLMITTNLSQDEIFMAAGSFMLLDLQTNRMPRTDDMFVFEVGTQFSVKQITAPVSGAVYIMCIY